MNFKDKINNELKDICVNSEMKQNIIKKSIPAKKNKIYRPAFIFALFMIFISSSVFAFLNLNNQILVNKKQIPDLEPMKCININYNKLADFEKTTKFTDYKKIQNLLGIKLLDIKISEKNPNLNGNLKIYKPDYINIDIKNYLILDADNNYAKNHREDIH